MFKRVRWITTGAVVGFGSAWWVERRVRERLARYLPDQVADDLAASARKLRHDLEGAVSEGRAVMRAREAELRGRVGARSGRHTERHTEPATARLRLVEGQRR